MLFIIIVLSFVSSFLLIYSTISYIKRDSLSVSSRLDRITESITGEVNNELNTPLYARIFKPIFDNVSKLMIKVTPAELISSMEVKIVKAGNPGNLTVKAWMNIEALIVIGLPALTFLICRESKANIGATVMSLFAEVALGFVLPGFMLGKVITARQKVILNSLPDVIDLLTVSVEAGLGFDGALMKVVEKKPGPLAAEFEKVLQEIKVGRQKKDALRDMAERIDIQDLTAFIGSVIQADQFGVGIANVLRIQAGQIRMKRRQRAQERAMKVPVKMLLPMVVFIFPTLFIVLLGPVVIQLIEQFANM
ncbi:MAG TPA: type II secretion system F family protein [Clostridia bacterium]|nr:type II secretion system F family protein [Clostridia bacterium]